MKKSFRAVALVLLCTLLLSMFPIYTAAGNRVDLARCSERFLSDFAISEGGNVWSDDDGNIIFEISSARHNLKFKCTGDSASGEQNAICLWMNNLTGSTKIYVDIVFMGLDGEQKSMSYIKDVENSGSDVYLFVPSEKDEFVVSISIKAAGVSEGTLSVMGIWHCYYYFPESVTDIGIGSISALKLENGGSTVTVEGNILHDITISSKDSTINVYRLLPGESLDETFVAEHEPAASCSMSRSFSFSIKNKTGSDFAAAYAITVNRADGSIEYIIEDKKYPDTEHVDVNNSDFKGISTSLEYMPTEMSVSSLIIDIDLSDLISEQLSGYLYSFGGVNYCFKSSVIDRIHRRITSHTADSGSVYLRLLVSDGGSPSEHMAYDADGEKAASLYAAVSFICERYGESINGIIAGNKFDTPYNYKNTSDIGYGDYIRKYSDYISVIHLAAKNSDPKLKVIIPISSNTEYYAEEEFGSDKYPMFAMLISMLEIYSEQNTGKITLMVCDATFPYVTEILAETENPNARDFETVPTKKEIMNLTAENAHIFERFLDYLGNRYGVTDSKYFYMWQPYGFREKEELCLAYIYNYFHLSSRTRVYSFFCDFSEDEYRGYFAKSEDMLEAILTMGSDRAVEYAKACLSDHEGTSFAGIPGYDNYSPDGLSAEMLKVGTVMPDGVVGSSPMMDFSSPAGITGWKKGVYSESVSVVSVSGYSRAIRATMQLPAYESEFAEIIYDFDRTMDLSGVSGIVTRLIIDSEDNVGPDDGISHSYTVKIALGSSQSKGIAEYVVEASLGTSFDIYVDTSDFDGISNITYMKISVQNNSGKENRLLMHICDINAYSRTLDDEELSVLFASAEDDFENDVLPNTDKKRSIAVVLLIFYAFATLSVVAVIAFKRNKQQK